MFSFYIIYSTCIKLYLHKKKSKFFYNHLFLVIKFIIKGYFKLKNNNLFKNKLKT